MAQDMIRRRTARPMGSELAREMVPLRTMMDRLFENAFMPSFFGEGRALGGLSGQGWFGADVDEDDDAYYISCQLPGIDPKDVTISAEGNVLTISGESKRTTPEGRRAISQESSYGRFERQFGFDTPVDSDKAEASYRDGVLEITLPKAETHRPRMIQIKHAEQAKPAERSEPAGRAGTT
jgi:HSP20 family protein